MEKQILVEKRDGRKEEFNIDKIHRVLEWATANVKDVNIGDIEINVQLNLIDGIKSSDIHKVLIETTSNLISENSPNYQIVASRLLNYQLRKDVWGGKNAPKLFDVIKNNIELGLYTPEILEFYSKKEIDKVDEFIDHNRDFNFTYAGIKQLVDKYLVQNRKTKQIFETPQIAYILIALVAFAKYPANTRLDYVKKAYNFFSKHKINLPTPIMAGVRTPLKSFASCLLAHVDDTMDSIFANLSVIGHATSRRYGIGFNAGDLRAIDAPIRGGEVLHTGVIPFLKVFEAAVKSCQQNGLRGGSATCTFPIFHYEIEDVLVLKNNAGTEENRVRKLDYSIGISKLFYERFLKNENITLFSSHECKDLYKSFGTKDFDEIYKKYEKDETLKFKKVVKARDLFELLIKERIETGRIYIINVDNANEFSPWVETVQMSNLCQEVLHAVSAIKDYNDTEGEIGICILAALNWLEINNDTEFEKVCDIVVRLLDEIIDYQDYFCPAAENFAKKRRSLGVGVTNLAAVLAKNGLSYQDKEAPTFVANLMEKQQFFLLKASNQLAKEKGTCPKFHLTKYSYGELPIDRYRKENVDKVVDPTLHMDWEGLRASILEHGLRHSTLTACMPCESSSVIQNSTNGVEPVRSIITYKKSKASTIPVIVPNVSQLKNKYTLAFDMEDNIGYLNVIAGIQKFCDMAISVNAYYDYKHYPNNLIPHSVVMKEILYHYSMGGKTWYYLNTNDGDKEQLVNKQEENQTNSCESGACAI